MSLESLRYIYLVFFAITLLEIASIALDRKSAFSWKESLTSLGVAVGHRLTGLLFQGSIIAAYSFAWQHRVQTISLERVWAALLLFLGIEFFYYWYHRASHQIRWLWVTHAVHHSPQHFNLSAAFRLGWTGFLSGNHFFFLPLCWLGFHPIAVLIGLKLNLLYQFWIHTELIPKLGWLEWFLNTPSHHRVHHASNSEYIDRNFGGVLIIFDRLFGTFASERATLRPRYGLTHTFKSYNPVRVAFHEWNRLVRDLIAANTWRDRLRQIWELPAD